MQRNKVIKLQNYQKSWTINTINYSKIFKTTTSDKEFEFADLLSLEKVRETFVYFANPYSAFENELTFIMTQELNQTLISSFFLKLDSTFFDTH